MSKGNRGKDDIMKNIEYTITEAIDLVKSDYVLIRETDGVAICNSDMPGERLTIGHVVEKLPMHIHWLDEIDTDEAANVLDDDGDNVWIIAPASYENYTIDNAYPFAYTIIEE